MNVKEQIILTKEKNGWAAFCLNYDGIVSQGLTAGEARKNIEELFFDALSHGDLEKFKSDKQNVDPYEFVKEIYGKDFSKDVFMVMLSELDLKNHLNIKDAAKAERTNVSIKKGYKTLAKMRGINISDFLNKALSKELDVVY